MALKTQNENFKGTKKKWLTKGW
uniref:Uncharacterized protein n=1 Tax=Tetranychus urticae TaxID=32264 RepID=T1K1P2_TETUR